ncbi:putative cytosol aminopeptidase [Enhygromyxa salina]|uniref:Putative cytosol aminopeptidase n=1 Tax=Enhygromyxa salina TaxID=215803 RepID=A0A2S9XCE7_9BACT|nr:leucyl aminopeptidase family protein [Enhygromyxa salina]PRP90351.1 putative cytosol aminopeptidase [Enhygromyxa salina]
MDNFSTRANAKTIPIVALTRNAYKGWVKGQGKSAQAWLKATAYTADAGKIALMPGRDGSLKRVVLGLGKPTRDPSKAAMWSFAVLPARLPKGRYQLEGELDAQLAHDAALGWALGTYRFSRYLTGKAKDKTFPSLVWPAGVDRRAVARARNAIFLGRDLITTPAGDLGPSELAEQAVAIATEHDAEIDSIVGEELLSANYPAIYAVGMGSPRAPRLIDLRWGDEDAPKLSLVGKGVVFDSGGLDLKSASGMKLMKKDMGGAASVLALAQMVMDAKLPVRLRVLIPAVENAISGEAFRPLDVLETRKGITIEVGNTDAEGRLILCDALAEADSEQPDLLIDFATLTGAARIALGTELPAMFSTDDEVAADILAAGTETIDPLWRLPLFRSYRRHLDSRVADINNIANVSQGGAITAALFLQEFVSSKTKWVHIDTMGYNLHARPGRPAGGEVFGVRAMFEMLRRRYAG